MFLEPLRMVLGSLSNINLFILQNNENNQRREIATQIDLGIFKEL